PPICSLFTGAGHYALKVENDGLTRRRGGFFTGSACRRSSASPQPSHERRRWNSSAISSRRSQVQLPPICSLFTGAGHYALKVENDGLTRRRGGRGALQGDWSLMRQASLRGLRASA